MKLSSRISAAYNLSFISLGLTISALGATLPDLAKQTRSSLSEIGILFTVRSLGSLCGNFAVGRVYDHYAAHPFFAGTLILMSLMLLLIPLVPYLWLLVGVFFLLGIAESGVNVGGNTLIVWVHGAKVGPFMNALHFFFGVGSFLSPIILAEAARNSGNLTLGYWILAALMIPAAVWLYRLPSPPAPSHEEINGAPFNGWLVGMIALFMFFLAGSNYTLGGWLVTYARELDLADKTAASYLYAATMGSLTFGRLIGIPIAARFRPQQIILTDLLGMLLSFILMSMWQNPLILWVGVILNGLSAASVFPAVMSYAGQHLTLTGNITSWFMVGTSLGGMLLPWLMGYIFEEGRAAWMMTCLALNMIMVIGIFLILHLYTERPMMKKAEAS